VRTRRHLPLEIALLGGLLAACSAATPDTAAGSGITIANVWARATTTGSPVGAAYFTLRNGGPDPDVLLSVASPAAQLAELHRTSVEQDVVRMRPAGQIEIGAGQTLAAEPGGLHVMLAGLHAPLVEGTKVPLELAFRLAGTLAVEITVRPATIGAMQHGHADQDDHASH
jgi:copper(I)-binding protein